MANSMRMEPQKAHWTPQGVQCPESVGKILLIGQVSIVR
jgi:hypothetical protein